MNSIDIIYSYMYSCEDEKKVLSVIDVHEKNITNKIPILYSGILTRRSNIVEHLMKKGYDPNIPCKHGIYPLHMAVSSRYSLCGRRFHMENLTNKQYNNYLRCMKKLNLSNSVYMTMFGELLCGKNISECDLSLLDKKLTEEQLRIIKLLLDYGANINAITIIGTSALLDAVYEENIEVVKLLLSYGINTHIRSNNGVTAFILAARAKNIDIMKCIIEHYDGYKNYLYDSTAINEAININNIDMVSFLLSIGLNTKVKDIFGNTPLHTAAICNNYDIAKLLLDHGVDPNIRNSVNRTPIYVACRYKKMITLLLDYGAYIVTIDKNNITPIDTLSYLLDNNSYLLVNCKNNYYESAKLLISNLLLETLDSSNIRDSNAYTKMINVISNNPTLNDIMFVYSCEIKRMKNTNIYSRYYFDMLLNKNIEPDIFRNCNVLENIYKQIDLFPMYNEHIKKNIYNARKRLKVIDDSMDILNKVLFYTSWTLLPIEIRYYILKFLTNKDLSGLITGN
ncbi:CNPV234 ankyrin repeat protein [Canarypox virus]|uniref:SWPV2-ORF220 n=2 Tax=Canarypox virus TaxID=44088 RepID=A0A1V0QGH5_CNPV|nr:CNPV234 ankyrin repeat protein [Canarypox virus]ARE67471.1 SWPV2-ORF220 [Shearwaterpox virus]QRM15866.1 ankyrin repeat protein [Penguinpox virus 2]QRM16203.1 ankyrin repeat protein [Albatrosspox virus]AAR83580.1 CNPV234 ankyrin repeat protein [Canarypox virus]AWD84710.1 ankyrin repeat protein [Canarypox virus]